MLEPKCQGDTSVLISGFTQFVLSFIQRQNAMGGFYNMV